MYPTYTAVNTVNYCLLLRFKCVSENLKLSNSCKGWKHNQWTLNNPFNDHNLILHEQINSRSDKVNPGREGNLHSALCRTIASC